MRSEIIERSGGSLESGERRDWAEEACKAERKRDWQKAQLLWERALIQSVPDGDGAPGDKEYGTGLVILSHLHDLMKEHFGFLAISGIDRFISKKKYSPVGHWEKLRSYRDAQSVSLTSGWSILVRILLALLLGAGFFLLSYPFSNAAANILLGGAIVLILAVAIFIGSLTNFWGGLIAFFVTAYLLDFLCDGLSEWLELGSSDLALLYILRAVGVLAGVILLCSAVVSMSQNRKTRRLRAEAGEGSAFLKRHAEACGTAAQKVCEPIQQAEEPEVAAIHSKRAYQSADRWHFQRVKGDVRKEGWGDALEMDEEVCAVRDYYEDMAKLVGE